MLPVTEKIFIGLKNRENRLSLKFVELFTRRHQFHYHNVLQVENVQVNALSIELIVDIIAHYRISDPQRIRNMFQRAESLEKIIGWASRKGVGWK